MPTYTELLKRLFSLNQSAGMKLDLTRVLHLRELMGYPDRSFETVHIAGTNGKGSVSLKIATALQTAGYRVGLYTSPHIATFRERIRVDGAMISETAAAEGLSFLFDLMQRENIPATFFELTTLLAFNYFASSKVDIAVIETGLGGRLDATNSISPLLSVITSISLDHTEILGNSLELIAHEKAGIIKPFTPVVCGPRVPLHVFKQAADEQSSPCIHLEQILNETYEEENCRTAEAALLVLAQKLQIDPTAMQEGLRACPACRFERIPIASHPLPIILDAAHNPDGIHALCKMVRRHYPGQNVRFLFGLSKTKDWESCLQELARCGSAFHIVEAPNGRGVPRQELLQSLTARTQAPIESHSSIASGVQSALCQAVQCTELLLICGTFFILAEARNALGMHDPTDAVDVNESGKKSGRFSCRLFH